MFVFIKIQKYGYFPSINLSSYKRQIPPTVFFRLCMRAHSSRHVKTCSFECVSEVEYMYVWLNTHSSVVSLC